MTTPITTSKWLKENLENSDLIILDASSKPNKSGGNPDFENLQIKNSRYFDLKNNFSDRSNNLPNTLPSPKHFEIECRNLGINESSKIIVYDNVGIYTSPRVWWMFKTMGHSNISVLDGGLPEWIEKGYDTETSKCNEYKSGNFKSDFQSEQIKAYDYILSNTKSSECLLIDARSSDRFKGISHEPRIGLKSGHIPNSINIHYEKVLNSGKFKSIAELKEIFKDVLNEQRPIIFSCGSGLTACIVLLAGELILKNKKSIYDGSWTEWAAK